MTWRAKCRRCGKVRVLSTLGEKCRQCDPMAHRHVHAKKRRSGWTPFRKSFEVEHSEPHLVRVELCKKDFCAPVEVAVYMDADGAYLRVRALNGGLTINPKTDNAIEVRIR